MRFTTYATAAEFLAAVGPTLAEHEAEHHLVLGVAEALAKGRGPDDSLFLASVQDTGGLALVALMSHGAPLLLASDRADVTSASALLWDALGAERRPRFVIGAVGQIERAVDVWTQSTGHHATVSMRQRAHKLTSVDGLPSTSGTLRMATLADADLVAEWVAAFEAEALAGVMPQSTRASTERRVAAGEIYLWCDPDPCTTRRRTRSTPVSDIVRCEIFSCTSYRNRFSTDVLLQAGRGRTMAGTTPAEIACRFASLRSQALPVSLPQH